ncbi:hypothetical protein PR048_020118 [Dryococelus australis]|uniref:Uncharacterized protein n=1 Tax=Dryococelus australis TaxID=614101 RepID=A0ABQ9H5D6_9NEOP|nr:hypothetical protein PR048_020118 [Dryococelus australis]
MHKIKFCHRNFNSTIPLKCANCNGNHTASNRECPAWQNQVWKYGEKSNNTTNKKPPQASSPTLLNFPELPRNTADQIQTRTPPTHS